MSDLLRPRPVTTAFNGEVLMKVFSEKEQIPCAFFITPWILRRPPLTLRR